MNRFVVNVPYNDQWDIAPLITLSRSGELTFSQLWEPHFGHRIVLPKLAFIALAKVTGWQNTTEVVTNFILVCLTGVLLLVLLYKLPTQHKICQFPLALVISTLIFSGVQGNSWIAGFQLTWFLTNLLALAVILFLAQWPGHWLAYFAAATAALGATYSLGLGQAIWIVGGIALLAHYRTWPKLALLTWPVLASLAIFGYHYQLVGQRIDLRFFLAHPIDFLLYWFGLLGSPLANFEGLPAAVRYGVCGLGLLFVSLVILWWRARDLSNQTYIAMIPWLLIAAYGIIGAGITAVARASWGVEEALQRRYTPVTLLFWVGIAVVSAIVLRELYLEAAPSGKMGLIVLSVIIAIFPTTSYALSYTNGYKEMRAFSYLFRLDQIFVLNYRQASDAQLLNVYYDPADLRYRAGQLEQIHEGPFHPTSLAQYQREFHQEQERWQTLLTTERYTRVAYPLTGVNPLYGDPGAVSFDGSSLRFVSPAAGENFLLDMRLPDQSSLHVSEKTVLDIMLKTANYVTLYWDTGKGFSEEETVTLFVGPQDEQGWKHYRIFPPTGVQMVRVDVHYPATSVQPDQLQVDLYQPIR